MAARRRRIDQMACHIVVSSRRLDDPFDGYGMI